MNFPKWGGEREKESLKIHGANIASDFITFALFFVGVEKFVV